MSWKQPPSDTERWLFLLQSAVIFNNLAVPFVRVPLSPIQMLIYGCNYICFASLHSQHGSKYFTQLWTTLQDEYIKDWKGESSVGSYGPCFISTAIEILGWQWPIYLWILAAALCSFGYKTTLIEPLRYATLWIFQLFLLCLEHPFFKNTINNCSKKVNDFEPSESMFESPRWYDEANVVK